jgi:hypothetical protein
MNKTLALIAALGLVVSAPAFAADEAATNDTTVKTSSDTAAPAKAEAKTSTKGKVAKSKEGKASKEAKNAKEGKISKEAKEETTGKTEVKAEGKTAKAAAASNLAPAAGGVAKGEKSAEKTEKTDTQQ